MKITRCRSHCAACGGHFSSDAAFDAHRTFAEGHEGDWDRRVCVEPADDLRFMPIAAAAVCDVYASNVRRSVTVWTLMAGVARARQRFRSDEAIAELGPAIGWGDREAA